MRYKQIPYICANRNKHLEIMTNEEKNQRLKLEEQYWPEVLEEATKEQILDLAKRMDIYTHHDNGRQRALKDIKKNIAGEKIMQFIEGLRKI